MDEMSDNKELNQAFTKGMHHSNTSILYIVQNLFPKGKFTRTMSLNVQYIVVFKSPRDALQVQILARQMKKPFMDQAFQDATREAHGYLFIDLTPNQEEDLRISTKIFPDEQRSFYLPATGGHASFYMLSVI